MTDLYDEGKFQIPEKYRATPAQLALDDANQAEWRSLNPTPIAEQTPKERERANAQILVGSLEQARETQQLTDTQREQLSEAYAVLGEYDRAAQTTLDAQKVEVFERYWEAVWLDDEDWCAHPERHKYVKEHIFSVRDSAERPLLACNACGMWNVADAPEALLAASRERRAIVDATRGMDMSQVKRFLEDRHRRQ